MRSGLALSTLVLLGAACADDPLTKLLPNLVVEPEAIDFGDGVIAQDNLQILTMHNKGSGILQVQGIDVEPADGIFKVAAVPSKIDGLQTYELDVFFAPLVPKRPYDGKLIIHSDDPNRPNLEVPLHGVGGIREIEVFPLDIDFGVVNEGTPQRRSIEIRNLGGDPLVISSLTFTSTSIDLGLAPSTPASAVIPAKTSTTIQVQYAPQDLGADRGIVVIASNDEDEPEVQVTVRGRGNLAPRAIAWGCDKTAGQIGCDGQLKRRGLSAGLRRTVGLDGRDSVDPEGVPITFYRWDRIARPPGSTANPFHSSDDRNLRKSATGDILVDQVGAYDLRLVVRDARGVESLDRPESHVTIGPKDLEVRLVWDIGTDVDLHFVEPGGAPGSYGNRQVRTSTGSDCSAFNREPNWNDSATNLDDPRLDRDEVTGTGPEIVSLDFPVTGTFTVYAHYCDSRNVNVNVHVTAEVYVRGVKVGTVPDMNGTRMLPGELWKAAEVSWDAVNQDAIVVPSTDPITSRPELCRN